MTKPADRIVSTIAVALLAMLTIAFTGCDKSTDPSDEKTREAQRLINASAEKFPLASSDAQKAFDAGKAEVLPENRVKNYAQSFSDRILENALQDYNPQEATAKLKTLKEEFQAGSITIGEFNAGIINSCQELELSCSSFVNLGTENRQKKLSAARQAAKAAFNMANGDSRIAPAVALATIELIEARGANRDLLIKQLAMQQNLISLTNLSGQVSCLQAKQTVAENSKPNSIITAQKELLNSIVAKNNIVKSELNDINDELKISKDRFKALEDNATELDKKYLMMLQEAEKLQYPERFEKETEAYNLRIGKKGIIEIEKQIELVTSQITIIESKIALKQSIFEQGTALIAKVEKAIETLTDSPATTTDINSRVKIAQDAQTDFREAILIQSGKLSATHKECVESIAKIEEYYTNAIAEYKKAGSKANSSDMENSIKNELSAMYMNQAIYYGALVQTLAGVSDAATESISTISSQFNDYSSALIEKSDEFFVEEDVAEPATQDPMVSPMPMSPDSDTGSDPMMQ
ncbi:MAG: hypothetical protein JEZ07_12895 [Phycisphaerae bacterium]|nr:hypothetical protein [Phycisphaerae bacterium]